MFVAGIVFVAFITAGITFASLAVAFPLVGDVGLPHPATDAAARIAAGYRLAFAALAVTSFGAAALVAVVSIRAIFSPDRA